MKKEKIQPEARMSDDEHTLYIDIPQTAYTISGGEYTITCPDSSTVTYTTQVDDDAITTVDYRGYSIPIYMDEPGQQYYCVFDGEEIGFGSYNFDYTSDLQYLIDEKLDVIHRFDKPYFGARLEWFENGSARDIKLSYRQRILKVWLVANEKKVDTDKLINESDSILAKLIK